MIDRVVQLLRRRPRVDTIPPPRIRDWQVVAELQPGPPRVVVEAIAAKWTGAEVSPAPAYVGWRLEWVERATSFEIALRAAARRLQREDLPWRYLYADPK
jgi:hypothetical protein